MSFFKSCIKCSKKILHILNSDRNDLFEYQNIGYGGDRSLKIDLIAEDIFVKELKKYGNIFSEESGFIDNKMNKTIILDPIDGSSNISNGVPYFGSSISLKKGDKVKKSFIINLANGDYFYRNKNGKISGNLFYKKKIYNNYLSNMVIFEKAYANSDLVKKLDKENIKVRGLGALALSIAYAKRVKAVVFIGEIREFDVSAGLHFNKDLFIKMDNNLLLVSKDKQDFDKISNILFKE